MNKSKDLKNKIVIFYSDDIEALEYSKTLLNFSAWVKEELRKILNQPELNKILEEDATRHGEIISNRAVVFSANDTDILNLALQLNFTKWVKSKLINELTAKKQKGEQIFKTCIICGKINLRRKVTCSDECEKLHKKKLQANADKLRNERDKEKRQAYQQAYQREYYKKKKAKK